MDVLEYVDSFNTQAKEIGLETLSSNNIIQIYYPYLAEKEYNTITQLESNREELAQETAELINDKSYINVVENVNLFYHKCDQSF